MKLIIYNSKKETYIDIDVNNLFELANLVEVYFEIFEENQIIEYNNIIIDINNPISFYNIKDGDMLTIKEKTKYNETVGVDDDDDEYNLMRTSIRNTMCYVSGSYNNLAFKIMIDSGAQTNVISSYIANQLGLTNKIDTRGKSIMKGVGSGVCLGTIYNCNICFNKNMQIIVDIKVLEATDDFSKGLVLFGLDFLYKYKCKLDFESRFLSVNGINIKLMHEGEIQKYDKPINLIKERLDTVTNNLLPGQRANFMTTMTKIITNIINNPKNDKYKIIDTCSKTFKDNIATNNECVNFLKSLGFIEIPDGKLKFANDIDDLHNIKEVMCY